MKWGIGIAVACAAFGVNLASPGRAAACSVMAPPVALIGYPPDGQVDVPTDVIPFYDLITARIQSVATAEFHLSSSNGELITVSAKQSHTWTVELTPSKPLQPNTEYTLTAKVPAQDNAIGVKFVTGSGPFAGTPAPPEGFLRHYHFTEGPRSSCDSPRSGTCVALNADFPVEARHVDAAGQEESNSYLYNTPFFTNLSGTEQPTNFTCLRLRSRAPNGTYSSPVELCGTDAPVFTLQGSGNVSCTTAGLTRNGAVVDESDSDDGCSISSGRKATDGVLPPFAFVLAAGLVRVLGRLRRKSQRV